MTVEQRYIHIYMDAEGESHFGDGGLDLPETDFAPPAPPLFISEVMPAAQAVYFFAPPGWFGDWHPAPRRQLFVSLAGELEVTVSDGEARRIRPGDVVLTEDTSGKGHTTRVIGDEAVRSVIVQLVD